MFKITLSQGPASARPATWLLRAFTFAGFLRFVAAFLNGLIKPRELRAFWHSNNHRVISGWLVLAVILSIFLPAFSSGTSSAVAASNGSDMIITDLRVRNDEGFVEKQVQQFLDKQPGPLKSYVEILGTVQQTAARSIANTSVVSGVNPRVVLVLLEVKNGLLSNTSISQTTIDFALGFDKPEQQGFLSQIELATEMLDQKWITYSKSKDVVFKDSSIQTSLAPNRGTFAVQSVFGTTTDQKMWEKQVGLGVGSFYDTYKKLFGDPLAQEIKPTDVTFVAPFLSRPFRESDIPNGNAVSEGYKSCDGLNYNNAADHGVNTFFDHQYPTYESDGVLVPYRGKQATDSSSCRWYSGHDGIDFALPTKPVLAAANGQVYSHGYSQRCGYNVTIIHPSFQNYRTYYEHLISQPSVADGSSVNESAQIGTDGWVDNTGGSPSCSTGPHLHFGVRNASNGVVDPFGFCPTSDFSTDPWEALPGTPTPSFWLWKISASPCTQQHQPPPQPPNPPSNLSAVAASSSQVNLSWSSNGGDGFYIERKTGASGSYGQIVQLTATSYQDSGLSQNTNYYYRVRAYNSSGNSGYSNEANATTQQILPQGDVNSADCSNLVGWTWDPKAPNTSLNVDVYEGSIGVGRYAANIYRDDVKTQVSHDNGLHGFSIPVPDGLKNNANHTLHFYALNTDSAGTNPELPNSPKTINCMPPVTTPTAPSGLTATTASATQINLGWTNNANNAAGNYVERKVDGGGYNRIADVSASTNSKQDTGLMPGSTYCYRVQAYNSSGTSGYSNEACATLSKTLSVNVSQLNFSVTLGGSSDLQYINLTNSTGSVAWTMYADWGSGPTNWSGATQVNGTVNAGTPLQIGIGVGAGSLATGNYNADLYLVDNSAPNNAAIIHVSMTVSAIAGLQYYPLATPIRLLDTRPGYAAYYTPGIPLVGGSSHNTNGRNLTYQGVNIPANAVALVGNATAVNGTNQAGFVTLYPGGATRPLVSNVNYVAGQVVPNSFTVGLGSDGSFNIFSTSGIDVVMDIAGYYAPPGAGGLYYHPLPNPVRLLDTRPGYAAYYTPGSPLTGGNNLNKLMHNLSYQGVTIPGGAVALVGNATVINGTNQPGYVTLFPEGGSRPNVSNVNYVAGQVVPNSFTVGLGGDGSLNIYSTASVDFIVDVTGYYSADSSDSNGAGLTYRSMSSPIRLLDTRSGNPAFYNPGSPLSTGSHNYSGRNLSYLGVNVPNGAVALVGNATVVNGGGSAGYATLYPGGASLPNVSNLNFVAGQVVPNSFTVGLGSDGSFNVYVTSNIDFLVDIDGYFAPGNVATSATKNQPPLTPVKPKLDKKG